MVCGSPAYFAATTLPARPEDLSKLSAVTFDMLGASASWIFSTPESQELRVPIHSRLAVNTAEAAIDAAIAGVGVTRVLSYQAAPAVAAGQLQVVLPTFEPAPLPIHLVHAGQDLLPLKTRVFLEYLAPRVRERVAELTQTNGGPTATARDQVRPARRPR